MSEMTEMARSLGQALGRTPEYQELKRVLSAADDDRSLVEARNEVTRLEDEVTQALRAGEEPAEDLASRYENAVQALQGLPGYQRLVAAQTNFDKVVGRVNQTIAEGIREGGESRIILTS